MSKMTFKGDIVHTEKYTDKTTNEERKKYTNIGALFEREDGSLCIKMLDSWLNIYPPKAREDDYAYAKKAVQETPQPHDGGIDDEIPFMRIPNEVA